MNREQTISDVLQGYANWYHEHVSRGGWTNGSHVEHKRACEVERLTGMLATLEARAETRQPVAWWIGPHDGLLAGATVNKNLADARIEHGATVRPLVFGDVAPSAEAGVTDERVERAAMAAFTADFDNEAFSWLDLSCTDEERYRAMARAALTAALTGGASA